jgi:hypothetical protein
MKLDRNLKPFEGKYALIKLRELQMLRKNIRDCALTSVMVPTAAIDFGDTKDSDFFVIRLKDKYAYDALMAYSAAAAADGQMEWSEEVLELARLAATHPNKQMPT